MRLMIYCFLLLSGSCLADATPQARPLPPDYNPGAELPTISPVLSVGEGEVQAAEGSIRPWRPEDSAKLGGRYRLTGITDGHGWLDITMHKTRDPENPWRVELKIVTEWTQDKWTTVTVENAVFEQDTPLPFFQAYRPRFVGFFVEFTDKSGGRRRPAVPAIVIGRDVFVRDDAYKPSSYREPAPAEAAKSQKH